MDEADIARITPAAKDSAMDIIDGLGWNRY